MSYKYYALALVPALFFVSKIQAKIIIPISQTEVYELPRSQIQTYIQKETLEANLKPIKAVKPSALSDQELLTVPERYLPAELKVRQKALKAEIAKKKKDSGKKTVSSKISDVVKISQGKDQVRSLKIDEAVWVSPQEAAKSQSKVLAPQKRLPDVEIITDVKIDGTSKIEVEIEPGESLEIERGLLISSKDPDKKPLVEAARYYKEGDYATSLTLSLGVLANKKSSEKTQMWARFVAAHSLFKAGFYASSLPHLVELASTPLRRSAVGIAAKAITITRDDAAANQILSKVSLSQIRDKDQPLFAFHLGRILLNSGAGGAALSSFVKVPEGHPRFPEAQYYMGVIRSSDLAGRLDPSDWDKAGTSVAEAKLNFENARTTSRTAEARDLRDLSNLAMARLAYQASQYNQAVFFYEQIGNSSAFVKDALFERAWALYKMGEFNRSLGTLHGIGSKYFVSEDTPELWILRALGYLKLCRFEEANRSTATFEKVSQDVQKEGTRALGVLAKKSLNSIEDLDSLDVSVWVKQLFKQDPVVRKDFTRIELLAKEKSRLATLLDNKRVADSELKSSVVDALGDHLQSRMTSVARALTPYLRTRIEDIVAEYRSQKGRLDVLKYEIYSQATKFPQAIDRPEAKKLLAKGEFLPGVYLRGHEILWRFSGESWVDELGGYDYFIPTECL